MTSVVPTPDPGGITDPPDSTDPALDAELGLASGEGGDGGKARPAKDDAWKRSAIEWTESTWNPVTGLSSGPLSAAASANCVS